MNSVTPDYFRAMSIPLLKGTGFSAADSTGAVKLVPSIDVKRELEARLNR